jgi:hypothetical protein
VWPDLSFFRLPAELVDSVTNAFPKQSHIKVDARKGKIRFIHSGAPPPEGAQVSLSCDPQ